MAVRKLQCPSGNAGYNVSVKHYTKHQHLNSFGEAAGEADINWNLMASFYGRIETGTGNEVYRAKKIHSETTAVVTLPYNSNTSVVDSDDRFEINGKNYHLLFVVNENEQNSALICGCRHESI